MYCSICQSWWWFSTAVFGLHSINVIRIYKYKFQVYLLLTRMCYNMYNNGVKVLLQLTRSWRVRQLSMLHYPVFYSGFFWLRNPKHIKWILTFYLWFYTIFFPKDHFVSHYKDQRKCGFCSSGTRTATGKGPEFLGLGLVSMGKCSLLSTSVCQAASVNIYAFDLRLTCGWPSSIHVCISINLHREKQFWCKQKPVNTGLRMGTSSGRSSMHSPPIEVHFKYHTIHAAFISMCCYRTQWFSKIFSTLCLGALGRCQNTCQ